jgi:hypothetical protein
MEEKIIGILKDISQLVIGVVVRETDETIVIKDGVLLGIGGQGNNANISLIPLDILSINPVVPIKHPNIVKDPSKEIMFTFRKDAVLNYDVEMADSVIQNYKQVTNRSNLVMPSNPGIVTPKGNAEDNIVKLF